MENKEIEFTTYLKKIELEYKKAMNITKLSTAIVIAMIILKKLKTTLK